MSPRKKKQIEARDIDPSKGVDEHALHLSGEIYDAVMELARYMGITFEEVMQQMWEATQEFPQEPPSGRDAWSDVPNGEFPPGVLDGQGNVILDGNENVLGTTYDYTSSAVSSAFFDPGLISDSWSAT